MVVFYNTAIVTKTITFTYLVSLSKLISHWNRFLFFVRRWPIFKIWFFYYIQFWFEKKILLFWKNFLFIYSNYILRFAIILKTWLSYCYFWFSYYYIWFCYYLVLLHFFLLYYIIHFHTGFSNTPLFRMWRDIVAEPASTPGIFNRNEGVRGEVRGGGRGGGRLVEKRIAIQNGVVHDKKEKNYQLR